MVATDRLMKRVAMPASCPHQRAEGDRTILGRISKRGNRYLRTPFMPGGRASASKPAQWWLMREAKPGQILISARVLTDLDRHAA
jgi:transposase